MKPMKPNDGKVFPTSPCPTGLKLVNPRSAASADDVPDDSSLQDHSTHWLDYFLPGGHESVQPVGEGSPLKPYKSQNILAQARAQLKEELVRYRYDNHQSVIPLRLRLLNEHELAQCHGQIFQGHPPDLGPLPGYALGAYHLQGHRPAQEDSMVVCQVAKGVAGQDLLIAGLFDGHGGAQIAIAAQKIVPQVLAAHLALLTLEQAADPGYVRYAIKNAFASKTHGYRHPAVAQASASPVSHLPTIADRLLEEHGEDALYQGSTALVLLQWGTQRYIANLGDSRAFLVRPDGAGIRLTLDQSTSSPLELKGIEQRGGKLNRQGRVGINQLWGINVARTLGDELLKGRDPQMPIFGLGSRCQVTHVQEAGTLVLGCDGLFESKDLIDTEMAHYIYEQQRKGRPPQDLAQDLARAALHRGSRDNISVMVLQPQDGYLNSQS